MGKTYEIYISDDGVKVIHHHATDGSSYKEFFPASVGEQILTLIGSDVVQAVKIEDWTKTRVVTAPLPVSPVVELPDEATLDIKKHFGISTPPPAPYAGAWIGTPRPLQGHLPDGFPGKLKLEDAGHGTYAKVRALIAKGGKWWDGIPGIGDKLAMQIEEAMAAPPEMTATAEETVRLDKVNKAAKELK